MSWAGAGGIAGVAEPRAWQQTIFAGMRSGLAGSSLCVPASIPQSCALAVVTGEEDAGWPWAAIAVGHATSSVAPRRNATAHRSRRIWAAIARIVSCTTLRRGGPSGKAERLGGLVF